jgi:hypothetical protein
VFSRRLSTDSRRFGTLYQFHLHRQVDAVWLHRPAYEDRTDRGFRNVDYQYSDAGKTPKRKHIKCNIDCNNLIYIQQDAILHSLFYLKTALHVSGGSSTHHQERKQLYLQHLIFVTLLLSAAIVEEMELVWVYCGWRTRGGMQGGMKFHPAYQIVIYTEWQVPRVA